MGSGAAAAPYDMDPGLILKESGSSLDLNPGHFVGDLGKLKKTFFLFGNRMSGTIKIHSSYNNLKLPNSPFIMPCIVLYYMVFLECIANMKMAPLRFFDLLVAVDM